MGQTIYAVCALHEEERVIVGAYPRKVEKMSKIRAKNVTFYSDIGSPSVVCTTLLPTFDDPSLILILRRVVTGLFILLP